MPPDNALESTADDRPTSPGQNQLELLQQLTQARERLVKLEQALAPVSQGGLAPALASSSDVVAQDRSQVTTPSGPLDAMEQWRVHVVETFATLPQRLQVAITVLLLSVVFMVVVALATLAQRPASQLPQFLPCDMFAPPPADASIEWLEMRQRVALDMCVLADGAAGGGGVVVQTGENNALVNVQALHEELEMCTFGRSQAEDELEAQAGALQQAHDFFELLRAELEDTRVKLATQGDELTSAFEEAEVTRAGMAALTTELDTVRQDLDLARVVLKASGPAGEELKAVRRGLAMALAELSSVRNELSSSRAELHAKSDQHQEVLEQVHTNLHSNRQELQELAVAVGDLGMPEPSPSPPPPSLLPPPPPPPQEESKKKRKTIVQHTMNVASWPMRAASKVFSSTYGPLHGPEPDPAQ